MEDIPGLTSNWSDFGYREQEMARELWKLFMSDCDETERLTADGVTAMFNARSGFVFLLDAEYNPAVVTTNSAGEEVLVDFLNCPECGYENNALDFMTDCDSECCVEFANELGLE